MDVFSDGPAAQPGLGPTPEEAFLRYRHRGPGPPLFHLPPPCPCASVALAATSLPLATLDSWLTLATPRPFPSLCLSLLFLSPFPLLSSALLLPLWDWLPATPVFSCLLWDWMAQRAGAACP